MRSFRDRSPTRIGLVSLAGLALLLAIAFSLNRIPFIARNYQIKAEFADAAGLKPENEVRVAGLKVGKVTSVELKTDHVLVAMVIDDGVEIPSGSRAEIALKTILGTKFVAINARADGPPLADGGVIPIDQTKIPFEIYQAANAGVDLLNDIDGKALNEGLNALADVADDPDRNLAKTLEGTAPLTSAIASQNDALTSFLEKGEQLVAALDDSSPDLQKLITSANRTLEILARRRASVQSLLRNTELLGSSLGGLIRDNRTQFDSLLRNLHAALIVVDRNLAEVEQAIRWLGPSSESLGRILYTGRWANICIYAIEGVAGAPPGQPVECAAVQNTSASSSVRDRKAE